MESILNPSHSTDTQLDPMSENSRLPTLGEQTASGLAISQNEELPSSAGDSAALTNAARLARGLSPLRPSPINPPAVTEPVSPSRFRSPSPGLHSPASSQIFERNVQDHPLPDDLTHSIPAHIQTEDHIPSVLEATSIAITDNHLNPDDVEIVMSTAHQPAAVGVPSATLSESGALSPMDDVMHGTIAETMEDNASTYGSIDPTDVRRLSFISFADVVQAEHDEKEKDSIMHMSITSAANRSPSPPVWSPGSSHGFGSSPPTSGAPSVHGTGLDAHKLAGGELTPRLPASPTLQGSGTQSPSHGATGGELMVETMRQALRKTGSGDLGGARSQPMSAVTLDEPHHAEPQS